MYIQLPERVTPYVGVWIETSWIAFRPEMISVTPYVGVWIETDKAYELTDDIQCHSLCGSVD